MHFNLLGPLEVWEGERRLRIGGPINERVLTMLLLEAGRVVPVVRLVEAVWDEEPPPTAVHQIRKAVGELRRRLPSGRALIVTEPPGYRALVDDCQLDLRLFDTRVRRAQEARAEGLLDNAVIHLKAALALWRGPMFAGAGGALVEATATAWEERYLSAVESSYELRLEAGEAGELVGELRELVDLHPFRESLRRHLMLALYRSGRQVEALDEYGRLRTLLAEELGIDPGPRLSELRDAILRGDSELNGPPPPAPVLTQPPSTVAGTVPCTLPCDLADFTGRQKEVAVLTSAVSASVEETSGPHMLVVDGMGGSGKTALVVHVAHRLAKDHPDGQLYLDLRGFTPGEEPLSAGSALNVLLRAVGVPGESIPEDTLGRIGLWRVTTARRRLLLVLDNAVDAAQVRPLLPASAGGVVLIASRVRLPELEGAEGLSLGLLSEDDSAELMRRIVGAERVAAEPEAAADLIRLCGRLPLALRVCGARLRKRPHWSLRHLAHRLGDGMRIIGELESGDRSVATALRMSYEAMKAEYRDDFLLLSVYPGTDFNVPAAAALLQSDPDGAERALEHLLDVHLLQQFEWGRYSFHDLVRSFAQTLPADAARQAAAARRLVAFILADVERACDALFPGRVRYGFVPGTDEGSVSSRFTGPEEALAWFAREWRNAVTVVHLALQHGLSRHAACIARSICFYLHAQSYLEDFEATARLAVEAARQDGDPELLCVSLINLAVAQWQRDGFQEGIASSEEALAVSVRLDDRRAEAACLSRLGVLSTSVGRLDDAIDYLTRAAAAHRELGLVREEAQSLANLCFAAESQGRHADAVDAGRRAERSARAVGDAGIEVTALGNLALAHLGVGQADEAMRCLRRALRLCEPLRTPALTSLVLSNLAEVAVRTGEPEVARDHATAAVEAARGNGSRARLATAENVLGRVRLAGGEYEHALAHHRSALQYATAIELRMEIARAHKGMGEALRALGLPEAAAQHDRIAAEHFTAMGLSPEPLLLGQPRPAS
ncbi:BTAD domain-containing putative transcriptional regulator [Streptomyces sp. NPDC047841]|uniref:AfsR/SARP family transcriptional regulator n=1 Tax=Streptomyces sp. NPDC047841 TaxID=3154708 RepID=UPI0034544DA9